MNPSHDRRAHHLLAGILACLLLCLSLLSACTHGDSGPQQGSPTPAVTQPTQGGKPTQGPTVDENGSYTSKEDVALYLHTYGHLPGNFISKTKAKRAGWVASEGNLDQVCPGKSIGGGRYQNDEGALPDAKGRTWTECDIGYSGGRRGPERMIFSNDGLIYYTPDHYRHFERLY
ncbi:MAG: ribonuclease domain-containing protein [Actinomycetota bacterium]|nr:ribonuclease domain-containing protein [Actinomycetota bacterium]